VWACEHVSVRVSVWACVCVCVCVCTPTDVHLTCIYIYVICIHIRHIHLHIRHIHTYMYSHRCTFDTRANFRLVRHFWTSRAHTSYIYIYVMHIHIRHMHTYTSYTPTYTSYTYIHIFGQRGHIRHIHAYTLYVIHVASSKYTAYTYTAYALPQTCRHPDCPTFVTARATARMVGGTPLTPSMWICACVPYTSYTYVYVIYIRIL
jgi:hypothetical protein